MGSDISRAEAALAAPYRQSQVTRRLSSWRSVARRASALCFSISLPETGRTPIASIASR